MRHRLRASLVTLALLAAVPVAAPASATAPCADATAVNRHVGFVDSDGKTGSTYNTRATIRDRDIYLCTETAGATSDGSAWVMLAGGPPTGLQYAQIGFGRSAGQSSESLFVQWNKGNCPPTCGSSDFGFTTYPSLWSAGTTRTDENVYNFSSGWIAFYSNGSYISRTNFDPILYWHPYWDGQWAGETIDTGDDVPGTSTSKTNFTSVGVKTCRSCGYTNPRNPITSSGYSAYRFEWVTNPTAFNIWTQR